MDFEIWLVIFEEKEFKKKKFKLKLNCKLSAGVDLNP